jgi:Gram-negative bacterial TonB protein C-terminal
MRAQFTRLVCVISLAVSTQLPAAPKATVFHATKPWDVDYGETQCTVMREYGDPADPVTLAIIPSINGATYQLVVAYKRPAPDYAEEFESKVDFGSGPITAWAIKYGSQNRKVRLYRFRISSTEMAQARNASTVTLHLRDIPDVTFALESMPALMDSMEKCTADLQDFWNLGGEKNGRIAQPSRGNIRWDFYPSDYPWEAIRRHQQGTSQYMLLVDERGIVAGCDVLKPSGVPVLDVAGCLVVEQRSRLTPARDAAGKPVRSTYVTPQVSWRLAS